MSLTSEIKEYAQSLGSELFAVTSAKPFTRYLEMLSELETIDNFEGLLTLNMRINRSMADPKSILPDAESIVVLGVPNKLQNAADNTLAYEGPYAKVSIPGPFILAGIGDSIAEYLQERGFAAKAGRIANKAAAVRAGLGNFGKNTLVYAEDFGSWILLVTVATNAKLDLTDVSEKDICGKCSRCIEACPTGAIYEPYKLDVVKCRAYLNHHHFQDVGEITDSVKEKMGNWILGCNVCQDVCPRNTKVKSRKVHTTFNMTWYDIRLPDKARLPLSELLQLLEAEVSPYFQRYAAISIGNMEEAEEALPVLRKMLDSEDQLVRKYAHWAIDRIEKTNS